MKAIFCASILTSLLLCSTNLYSQSCENLNLEAGAELPSTCFENTMTMLHDQLGRPYLYVATKEGGLQIYWVSNIQSPVWVAEIPVSMFDNLHVMNLCQSGNYLYLAIGNHFGATQKGGMAIVDVSEAEAPFVNDFWTLPEDDGGAGIVKVEGSYAYLGAMRHGLVILNVADKGDIQFVSQFVPEIDFPDDNPDPAKINARGMEVENGVVYLCYDAGGLRIINANDPFNPVETGRYANPALNGLPRAYNNVVLNGSLAYVAVDYCGLEVLDVSDPQQISLTGWWNPWNCHSNPLNWFVSPGHTNEISYNPVCDLLFVASGKSDLHVLDVSDPAQPDSCNFFGGVSNGIGTWGVSTWQNHVYLSYICNPLPIPFPSNWTGVKILTFEADCLSVVGSELPMPTFSMHPNPVRERLNVHLPDIGACEIRVHNILGQAMPSPAVVRKGQELSLDFSQFLPGVYVLTLNGHWGTASEKLLKIGAQ